MNAFLFIVSGPCYRWGETDRGSGKRGDCLPPWLPAPPLLSRWAAVKDSKGRRRRVLRHPDVLDRWRRRGRRSLLHLRVYFFFWEKRERGYGLSFFFSELCYSRPKSNTASRSYAGLPIKSSNSYKKGVKSVRSIAPPLNFLSQSKFCKASHLNNNSTYIWHLAARGITQNLQLQVWPSWQGSLLWLNAYGCWLRSSHGLMENSLCHPPPVAAMLACPHWDWCSRNTEMPQFDLLLANLLIYLHFSDTVLANAISCTEAKCDWICVCAHQNWLEGPSGHETVVPWTNWFPVILWPWLSFVLVGLNYVPQLPAYLCLSIYYWHQQIIKLVSYILSLNKKKGWYTFFGGNFFEYRKK